MNCNEESLFFYLKKKNHKTTTLFHFDDNDSTVWVKLNIWKWSWMSDVRISQYFFSRFWFNKTSMSLCALYSNLMTHVLICQCSKVVRKGSGNQVIVDESPRLSDFFDRQVTLKKPLMYVSFHCRVTHTYKDANQKIWDIPMQNVCCVSWVICCRCLCLDKAKQLKINTTYYD